ncbi:MAG: peptidoglycan DD-metalloendopeptidase family protein [Clostridia bacterium]|nr:peptidoglycan DD-metalloendopeptidase family protein [Clostridia bacterium]
MERVMTVEEKIRRAEEIYQRKKQGEERPVAKVTVNDKKDIKLLKKMIIQMLICVVIYLGVYMVQNNQYVFSEDFIQKANEILSYDTNFMELYEMVKNQVMAWIETKEQPEETPENSSEQPEESQENAAINEEAIGGAEVTTEEAQTENLSPEEQEIQNIKNTTSFIKPVQGVISSKYGQRDTATGNVPKNHTGTDIAANLGTKIVSATDGEVVLASEEGDYGKHLKIQIGEVSIIYAHCNNLYVKQGDKVTQGQEIAEVGSTGNSTGPHLHFEIRISEKTVDPQSILEL